MSDKLIISWEEYNKTVEKLAIQIHESGYKPTILIGIMRGAAPMIDVLSRIFKLKCAYLAVESYSGKGVEDEQGDLVFSREMSSIAPNMGGRILLCDDLSDTGITFNKSVDWLRKYEPIKNKIEAVTINPLDFFISLICNPGEINFQNSHKIYGKATIAPKINEDHIEFISCCVGFSTCNVFG